MIDKFVEKVESFLAFVSFLSRPDVKRYTVESNSSRYALLKGILC